MCRVFLVSFAALALLLTLLLTLLAGCAETIKKEAVYIPTKCKTAPIPKPYPHRESSISEEIAEILQYTEMLEKDLEFCRGDQASELESILR